jgi:hypothetical protein
MFGGVAGWCSVAGRIAFSGFIHASRYAAMPVSACPQARSGEEVRGDCTFIYPVSNYAAAAKSKNVIAGKAKWSGKLTQRR